jgi:hypothetical protein
VDIVVVRVMVDKRSSGDGVWSGEEIPGGCGAGEAAVYVHVYVRSLRQQRQQTFLANNLGS